MNGSLNLLARPVAHATGAALVLLAPAVQAAPVQADEQVAHLDELWRFLDRDGDGSVSRYEGAEALLYLTGEADQDGDDALTRGEIEDFLDAQRGDVEAERRELFQELDADGDGVLRFEEVPEELWGFLERADSDGDGAVREEELLAAEGLDDPRAMFEGELLAFLQSVDADGDQAFALEDLPPEERAEFAEDFAELDADDDGLVTRGELFYLLEEELRGAVFEVEGRVAHMQGVIGPTTPARVLELILEHPEVDIILMPDVPGSMDDEANLRAARLVRARGLATRVPAGGEVASGGTDFFLAGAERSAGRGARFGVHSWGGLGEQGADVPADDPQHQLYLEFYREIAIPEDFYWYTLEAAPAEGIHWMTREELERYEVLTTAPPREERDVPETGALLPDIPCEAAPRGIVPLPSEAPGVLRDLFVKYTRLLAPNGEPIHFFAQDEVTDEMLVRAREVMRFYLANAPGTRFGADKGAVANAMAENRAALVYFNTERDSFRAFRGELGELDLFFQDLYAEESVVEGSPEYFSNSVRDATLEEVFHLVHGAGIEPALPDYFGRIEEATRGALEARSWFTNEEWEREGSSPFEYIISVIDVYYGFWAHDPHHNGESFGGEYRYCTRSAIEEHDALGVEVLREFLPATFDFHASIAASFEGTFSLEADPAQAYTEKSRYLRNVQLTGAHDSALVGNEEDNVLRGNVGNNRLQGGGGDDHLLGGTGVDVATFRGPLADYDVRTEGDRLVVTDRIDGRDGTDRLRGIEWIEFADTKVTLQ